MSRFRIESVCVFGSSARMMTDCLSDRDVLVVVNDGIRRDEIVKHWRKKGWSVAVYSPHRLLNMIESASLFILHLQLEGIIVEDANGWLARQLRDARPKLSYNIDAQRSVFLALPLERLDENTTVSEQLIAADLAYVATRNFGVCYLADRDRLTFDYTQIIEYLGKDFHLSVEEVALLKSLRSGKVAYRTKRPCSEVRCTVRELRTLLSKFFVERPLCEVEHNTPIRNLGSSGYCTLRDFEAWLVSRVNQDCIEQTAFNEFFNRVLNWICDPRYYSWSIRNICSKDLEVTKTMFENLAVSGLTSQRLHDPHHTFAGNAVMAGEKLTHVGC